MSQSLVGMRRVTVERRLAEKAWKWRELAEGKERWLLQGGVGNPCNEVWRSPER